MECGGQCQLETLLPGDLGSPQLLLSLQDRNKPRIRYSGEEGSAQVCRLVLQKLVRGTSASRTLKQELNGQVKPSTLPSCMHSFRDSFPKIIHVSESLVAVSAAPTNKHGKYPCPQTACNLCDEGTEITNILRNKMG